MRNRAKGSAIIQGVVGLWLLIGGTVLGVLLLVNVGGATYGREKLGFIADQAAAYASSLPATANKQALVSEMVIQLIKSMDFSTTGATVTVTDTTVSGQPAVQVSVRAPLTTLLSGAFANIIPGQISMPYTATAATNKWCNGYAQCTLLGTNQTIVCPVIDTNSNLPNDGLPGYVTTILGRIKMK